VGDRISPQIERKEGKSISRRGAETQRKKEERTTKDTKWKSDGGHRGNSKGDFTTD